jgi:hypothetical protein
MSMKRDSVCFYMYRPKYSSVQKTFEGQFLDYLDGY